MEFGMCTLKSGGVLFSKSTIKILKVKYKYVCKECTSSKVHVFVIYCTYNFRYIVIKVQPNTALLKGYRVRATQRAYC